MMIYAGVRPQDGALHVLVVSEDGVAGLPQRTDLWNHSATGFEWGYCGSGPAQLALAILAHATGCDNVAIDLHQKFKVQFIAKETRLNWTMDREDILAWVVKHLSNLYLPPTQFKLGEEGCNGA